jgi:ribonucleoside-diphosphate reductase alpha chain
MKTPRPKEIKASVVRIQLTCGKLYVTVGENDNKVYEVFATIGKSGGCTTCFLQSLTLAISQGIRHGIPVDEFYNKLIGTRCPSPSLDEGNQYLSCVDAIGQVLKRKESEFKKNDKNV